MCSVAVYIGLGSNLGDRDANLSAARRSLASIGEVTTWSSVYETEPWGTDELQPAYLNQVVALKTGLAARELIRLLLEIEVQLGRRRTRPGASRVIDLDLLLYGDVVIDEPGLAVPHPRMHLRSFVLVPLAEIAPEVLVPGLARSVLELAKEAGQGGVRRLPGVTGTAEGGGR